MTYFCLYNTITGHLLDIDTTPPDDVPPECSLTFQTGEIPDRYFYKWDISSKTFIPRSGVDRSISVLQFLNKFTPSERIIIKEASKTNPGLSDYFDMVNIAQYIDLDDPMTKAGLGFLAQFGIIAQDRVSEILA